MDPNRRLSVKEVADLMRQNGFPVIGDDCAWLAMHGVVLDFSVSGTTPSAADESDDGDDFDDYYDDHCPESCVCRVRFSPPVRTIITERGDARGKGRLSRLRSARLTRRLFRRLGVRPVELYR